MILIDSSAWIEYYSPRGRDAVQRAVAAAIERDEAAVNGIVYVEIAGFASPAGHREALASDFKAFHWLAFDRAEFECASELGAVVRGKGITIPVTDLIIAASTFGAGASLYHVDNHFDQIACRTDLKVVNLREQANP